MRRFIGSRVFSIQFLFNEYFSLVKRMGSTSDLYENKSKLRARIIMNAHVIEKGLSFKDVKLGFGKEKITILLKDLTYYYEKCRDNELAFFCLSIIGSYLTFNKERGVVDDDLWKSYLTIKKSIGDYGEKYDYLSGGSMATTRENIQSKSNMPYLDFVKSRHTIRNFTGENIDVNLINQALKIAEYTPSACNRQPWNNHVFLSKEKLIKILDFQTGARQFKHEISCAILVTSSYSSFFGFECHQPYVNGGMYAMNLIFALHSLGLGTVPLNMGLPINKLKILKDLCDIKKEETPILLIGVGIISEKLNVAKSKRFSYNEYTKYY